MFKTMMETKQDKQLDMNYRKSFIIDEIVPWRHRHRRQSFSAVQSYENSDIPGNVTVHSNKTCFLVEAIRYVPPRYRSSSTTLPRRTLVGAGNTLIIITWFRTTSVTLQYIIAAANCKIYQSYIRECMSCLESDFKKLLD